MVDDHTSVTDSLLQVIAARYGRYLTAEQLIEVCRGLERAEQTAQTLRRFRLTYGDEPLMVFIPRRTERD
jgi:citrate lyase beta subunit